MIENSPIDEPALCQRLPVSAVFGIKAGPGLEWPRLWMLQHRELARLMSARIAAHGAGAVLAERGHAGRTWKESLKSGQGAAVGRAVSVIVKGAISALIAVVLTLSVLIDGF